jgi:hypothetical protein
MEGLPNVIIIGVTKAGTTSLRQYLIDHPEIAGAKIKETFFWNRDNAIDHPDLDRYKVMFEESNATWLLDNTPRYFHDLADKCNNLKTHLGSDLKVILILREPKSRVFSFYKFKKRRLEIAEQTSFTQYVEQCLKASDADKRASNELLAGVDEGCYAEPLGKWESAYGDQLKVVFFDQLKSDPTRCVQSIASWLELDGSFYDQYDFKKENQSVGFKNRGLHKLGMGVYKTLEPILLKNKGIRRMITNAYYALNGKTIEEKMTEESKSKLDAFYSHSITELSKLHCISKSDYKPEWINK